MLRTSEYAIRKLSARIVDGDAIVRGILKASYLYSQATYYIVEDLVDGKRYHVPTWLVSWEV